jgi:hypothetical protein
MNGFSFSDPSGRAAELAQRANAPHCMCAFQYRNVVQNQPPQNQPPAPSALPSAVDSSSGRSTFRTTVTLCCPRFSTLIGRSPFLVARTAHAAAAAMACGKRVCWCQRLRPRSQRARGKIRGQNTSRSASVEDPRLLTVVRRPRSPAAAAAAWVRPRPGALAAGGLACAGCGSPRRAPALRQLAGCLSLARSPTLSSAGRWAAQPGLRVCGPRPSRSMQR